MNKVVTLPAWIHSNEIENSYSQTPAWFSDWREKHRLAFLNQGLPTRHDERWKYADFSFLANKIFHLATCVNADHLIDAINQHRLQRGDSILLVFVNGYFMPSLSDMAKLPENVVACRFHDALTTHEDIIKKHWPKDIETKKYPFASLNAAACMDGLFFYLPDQCELTAPIHFLSITLGKDEFIAHPHHMIILGEQSKAQFVDEYFSLAEQAYMRNIFTTIVVGKSAALEYYKIQQEGRQAVHVANTFVQQQQDSSAIFMNFSVGGCFSRDDLTVTLQETGADCRTSGFYRLHHDNQYIDNHIDIDHVSPGNHSEMLFKGILDKKSRAVFNGRLHVAKDAQRTSAYQANHNLMLSNNAEIYSKPELEIYADDVKCKHGATTGQLDQDALFYMRARGIDREEAMDILLRGFSDEIMQRITHPGVKMRVQEIV